MNILLVTGEQKRQSVDRLVAALTSVFGRSTTIAVQVTKPTTPAIRRVACDLVLVDVRFFSHKHTNKVRAHYHGNTPIVVLPSVSLSRLRETLSPYLPQE